MDIKQGKKFHGLKVLKSYSPFFYHCRIMLEINIKKKKKVTQSCPTLQPQGLYSPWNSPGQNTGVGSCSLLQGIFPIQGSNPSVPHCRRILYRLSHQGSPNIKRYLKITHTFSNSMWHLPREIFDLATEAKTRNKGFLKRSWVCI